MARVNLETSAFAAAKKIARKTGLEKLLVVGMLANLWHDSQALEETEGSSEDIIGWLEIPEATPREQAYGVIAEMAACGILKELAAGRWQIVGNDKHIENLRARREAGKQGGSASGKVRAKRTVEAHASTDAQASVEPRTEQSSATQNRTENLPRAGAPQGGELAGGARAGLSAEIVRACCDTWLGTLKHFGYDRGLTPVEQTTIGRGIQQFGAEAVDMALYGARFEPKFEGFDPRERVSVDRIFMRSKEGKNRFTDFLNWGHGARTREARMAERKAHEVQAEEHFEESDPAKVRQILAEYGLAKRDNEMANG